MSGINVVVKEVSLKFVEAARARIAKNLGPKFHTRMSALSLTVEYTPLTNVDMVIEAALENPRLKQEIFKSLQKVCGPDCILATNTSTINIDLIGKGCPEALEAGRVVGAHFFPQLIKCLCLK